MTRYLGPTDIAPYPYRQSIPSATGPRTVVLVAAVYGHKSFPDTPIPHAREGLATVHTGPWRWLLAQRYVSGWGEAASGFIPADPQDPATFTDIADEIAEKFGTGVDYLSSDRYRTISPTAVEAHIKRYTPAGIGAYCGISTTTPADLSKIAWHCVDCTDVYRAEHYGRCPIEAI